MVIEALRASQKVYLSSSRTSRTMSKHRCFHLKKIFFFEIQGLTEVKYIFFEVTNFLEIFFEEAEIVYDIDIDCVRYVAEHYHRYIWDFEVLRVFLGPFLGIERRKWAEKSGNRQSRVQKIITTKNLRVLAIFQKKNLRCPTKSH